MSFVRIHSAQHLLLDAQLIDVEIDISKGLHSFSIVGLGDKAVDESRDRVSAAIKNSGFTSPKQKNEKVLISLAPAHSRKTGPLFDVAIAIGYLLASEEIYFNPIGKIFIGELSLNGKIQKSNGILPLVIFAKKNGFKEIYIPYENREEAGLIEDIAIYPAKTLREIIEHIHNSKNTADKHKIPSVKIIRQEKTPILQDDEVSDLSHIKEQGHAKRALQIAAAGKHNIALFGPPGTGKTLLAKAFQSLLPPLSFEQSLEITSIHSVAGILRNPIITKPPFRSPHHTSSYTSIVGGGNHPRPGEITLSHHGVLFLDEFPEFDKRVIESLRQPLEDKYITISRIQGNMTFPAQFILVAALNPCPCGFFGSQKQSCICAAHHVLNYQKKISGPIMDRIDMWVEVAEINHASLLSKNKVAESDLSTPIRNSQIIQNKRFQDQKTFNGTASAKQIEKLFNIKEEARILLNNAAGKLNLSPRGYHKVLKVSQTIADLEGSDFINDSHILEALQYRQKISGG